MNGADSPHPASLMKEDKRRMLRLASQQAPLQSDDEKRIEFRVKLPHAASFLTS